MPVELVELTTKPRSSTNQHKVSAKQWTRWSSPARREFNDMYTMMRDNQSIISPPSMQKIPRRAWLVFAWNVAWLAADAVDGK